MQVILLTLQNEFVGSRDRALESVTKAAIVLGQTGSGNGLGDSTRRLEDQSGATNLTKIK